MLPSKSHLSLQDLPLTGKRVLIRVDFNVPLNKDGSISDATRIRESLPTIEYALSQGAKVILLSHLGRPSQKDPRLSLAPCATYLSQALSLPVLFIPDCLGPEVEKAVQSLKPSQVLLLENLRFYPAEENPALDPSFAQKLAQLGDCYINDAFACSHRDHSSITTITRYFPGLAASGILLEKELFYLQKLLQNPTPPFYAIIGGSKISTKLSLLQSLLKKVEALYIGGAMAYTFLKALGHSIGDSLYEEHMLKKAQEILSSCQELSIPLWLPQDLHIASSSSTQILPIAEGIPPGWQGMDIGPQTIDTWSHSLQNAQTIFWNGPLGAYEIAPFDKGTKKIAQALSNLPQKTAVIGGGDLVSAINQAKISGNFAHVSTGGGACLELLEKGTLPGIEALSFRPG